MLKRIDKLFNNSMRITIDDNSKIVIMSDCHRGSGDNYDNFNKNKNIFLAALNYYYKKDFTYIELGDGDDMWEVKNYKDIVDEYIDVFKKIKVFYKNNRLIMIYGNHDIEKKNREVLKKYFYKYIDRKAKKEKLLLDNLDVYESVVLNYRSHDIFLLHGHQVDVLNGLFWRLSRFLVKHLWRALEKAGVKEPTTGAKNYKTIKGTAKKLKKWSDKKAKIVISGHTHRAVFPNLHESLYFNPGCCIYPNGITCLEIEKGEIRLIKWLFQINSNNLVLVKREVLEKEDIMNFFNIKIHM